MGRAEPLYWAASEAEAGMNLRVNAPREAVILPHVSIASHSATAAGRRAVRKHTLLIRRQAAGEAPRHPLAEHKAADLSAGRTHRAGDRSGDLPARTFKEVSAAEAVLAAVTAGTSGGEVEGIIGIRVRTST